MANGCKGCQWNNDIKVCPSEKKKVPYACVDCKATYKGGSNYTPKQVD